MDFIKNGGSLINRLIAQKIGEIKNLLIENTNGFDSCETVIEKLAQVPIF